MSDAQEVLADVVRALHRLVDQRVTEQTEQLVDITTGVAPALMPRRAAAAYLSVSGSQVDRLWQDGALEAVHEVGKGRLYTRESLDRLIDERKQTVHTHNQSEIRRLAG